MEKIARSMRSAGTTALGFAIEGHRNRRRQLEGADLR